MNKIHYVRGGLIALLLGIPLLFFGANAAYAIAANVLAGFLPSRWFSSEPADWLFSDGRQGGAANYFIFVFNAVPAYLCYFAIRWGFTGKTETF